jgi:nucleoside-diphosphate-sugar epimerase
MDEVAFSTFGDTRGEIGPARPSVRILITGSRGYLGAVLEKQALDAGWVVSGLDMDLYRDSTSAPESEDSRAYFQQLQTADLTGYQAIVHLAGISSDAASDLRPHAAARINGTAAVELARRAKNAGVPRFVFASTCSVYGSAPDRVSSERSRCAPISNYAQSKLEAEQGILAQASTTFAPVVLRFATLYGLSPNLRTDLVVNSMVTSAWLSGEISLHGSGEQSRPLVDVQDAASTVLDVLKAGDDEMRGEIFNVTDGSNGYSVADIAELVRRQVPGSRIVHHPAAADRRHYMADGSRIRSLCRGPSRPLEEGIAELSDALRHSDWQRRATAQECNRARRLSHLLERGELTDDLRWCG